MDRRDLALVSVLALTVVASGCAGGSNSSDVVAEGNTLVYDLDSSAASNPNISLTFADIGEDSYEVNMSITAMDERQSRSFTFSRGSFELDSITANEQTLLYVMPLQTFSTALNLSESDIDTLMEDGETIEVSSQSQTGTFSRSEEFSYQGRSAYNVTIETEGSSRAFEFTLSSERPYPVLQFSLPQSSVEMTLVSVQS